MFTCPNCEAKLDLKVTVFPEYVTPGDVLDLDAYRQRYERDPHESSKLFDSKGRLIGVLIGVIVDASTGKRGQKGFCPSCGVRTYIKSVSFPPDVNWQQDSTVTDDSLEEAKEFFKKEGANLEMISGYYRDNKILGWVAKKMTLSPE